MAGAAGPLATIETDWNITLVTAEMAQEIKRLRCRVTALETSADLG